MRLLTPTYRIIRGPKEQSESDCLAEPVPEVGLKKVLASIAPIEKKS